MSKRLVSSTVALAACASVAFAQPPGPPGGSPPGGGPPGGGGPASATVAVDCAAGDSINAALQHPARELTVEISGICDEDVIVRRDRVTLRGTDPAADGIRAATRSDLFSAALFIREARHVRVENLQLTGGANGLRIETSPRNVSAANLLLHGNHRYGAVVLGSILDAEDITSTNNALNPVNGGGGIGVTENGRLTCERCTVEDNPPVNPRIAVSSTLNSVASFSDSTLSGSFALLATTSSAFGASNSTLSGGSFSVAVSGHSDGRVGDSTLDGSVLCEAESELRLANVTQTASPSINFVDATSRMDVRGEAATPSTLLGVTFIDGFSNAQFDGDVTLGDLICQPGSDARCSGAVTKTSSSCGLCP